MSPLDSSSADDFSSVDDDLPAFNEAEAAEPGPLVEEEDPGVAEAPAALPASRGGVVLEKPSANIYTVMLIVSFIAILIGITCLSLELSRYEWKIKAR
jgi:hypothetical protein